jgi:hypothetical protein
MTITFERENDIIVYALEKIISFARENQYFFVANCAWWIASIIGLDSELKIFIDNLESRKPAEQYRDISTTPRDIARSVSVDPDQRQSEESNIRGVSPEISIYRTLPVPVRRTRKGRINPTPQSKRQLRKARRAAERKRALQNNS